VAEQSGIRIEVDCYAGYRGEQTPRRIRFAAGPVDVREILDRWLSPDHRYFKIRGDDAAVYIIRHDVRKWIWELVFYQSAAWTTAHDQVKRPR
jgi:hypothetical protein